MRKKKTKRKKFEDNNENPESSKIKTESFIQEIAMKEL